MDNVVHTFYIKEVILSDEKERVINFLKQFDLNYEEDITYSLYMEDENGKIVGTVSLNDYIIKCLAVDSSLQGENLAGQLINKLIEKLKNDNKFYYSVYTKLEYEPLFISLGFTKIVSTDKVSMLEFGTPTINNVIDRMKSKIEQTLDCKLDESKVCAVVAKADPFTNGHLSLVEEGIVKRYDYVIVFVLQEDKGFFTGTQRLALAYASLIPYDNVCVVPSTKYIISSMTFPGYFLHDAKNSEWAKIDALIFREYFMKKLNITMRFVGSETDDYMKMYNSTLKEVLGDNVEIVERTTLNGEKISAKRVRKLFQEGNLEEALQYVPRGSWAFYRQIFANKNNNDSSNNTTVKC